MRDDWRGVWSCCGEPVSIDGRGLRRFEGCTRCDHTDRWFRRDGLPEYRFPPHLAALVEPRPEATLERSEAVRPDEVRYVAGSAVGPLRLYEEVSKRDFAGPAPEMTAARALELPRAKRRPNRLVVRSRHLDEVVQEAYKRGAGDDRAAPKRAAASQQQQPQEPPSVRVLRVLGSDVCVPGSYRLDPADD